MRFIVTIIFIILIGMLLEMFMLKISTGNPIPHFRDFSPLQWLVQVYWIFQIIFGVLIALSLKGMSMLHPSNDEVLFD